MAYEIHPEYKAEGDNVEAKFPDYKKLMERLKVQGAPYGCKYDDISVLSNTYKALLVGEHAKTLGVEEAYIDAMFEAYFSKALNIGDIKIIDQIAASVGIDPASVQAAINNPKYQEILTENNRLGREYGINSVPTFIINNKYKVVGAQPPEQFIQIFKQLESGKIL